MLNNVLAVLFVNHDSTRISVDSPILLHLSLFLLFSALILITLKKTVGDRPLSMLQTNQMKGAAILIIIIHHLSVHTIKNPHDLLLFMNAGVIGVAIFLILSGLGLSISIEKKGIKNFFTKRFIRIFMPLFLALSLEVILSHIFLAPKSNLFADLSKTFLHPSHLDRNIWFVIFIIFWYCMNYLVFKLNLSKKAKLIFLCSVALILLFIPRVHILWKLNAFSFPLGCWLGLNSQFASQKIATLLEGKFASVFALLVGCLLLAPISYYFSHKHILIGIALIFSTFTIVGLTYLLKRNERFEFTIENLFLVLAVVIVYRNCSIWFPEYNLLKIASDFLMNVYVISAAFSIFIIISLMIKFNLYSYFLNFVGEISFELYLLHGMFMYSFDFILFRGNVAVTFWIYFIAICLLSLFFRKINSMFYDSLLNKMNNN